MREIKASIIPAHHLSGIIAALIGLALSVYVGGAILTLALLFVGFGSISLARQPFPIERFERIEAELKQLEIQISKSELRTNDRVRLIESQIQQTRLDIDKLKVDLFIPKASTGLGVGAMSAVLLALVVVGIGVLRWGTVPRAISQLVQPPVQQSVQQTSLVISDKIPNEVADIVSSEKGTVSLAGQTASGELHKVTSNAPFLIPSQQRFVNFVYRLRGNLDETPRAALSMNSRLVVTAEDASLLAEQRWNSRNSVAFRGRTASAAIERIDPSVPVRLAVLSD